jgi:hypothetical protein
MADERQQESEEQAPPGLTWREFLESYPLNSYQLVAGYYGKIAQTIIADSFG